MSKGFKKTMQAFKRGELATKRGRVITDRSEAHAHACAAKKAERIADSATKKK